MFRRNHYSLTETLLFDARQGPDKVWYSYQYRVDGQRKFINGQEVNDDGTPKKPNRAN